MSHHRGSWGSTAALALACATLSAGAARAERIVGPATVDLGDKVARIDLAESYAFLDGPATRKVMQEMGNTVDNTEVGLVSPQAQDEDWFIVFEYKREGYIKDDEKDKIDKDEILKSYQEGTEEANKARKAKGIPAL